MTYGAIFQWIYNTSFASAIRESSHLFPWIESVHVLAITIVVGSIAVVDLRMLGLTSMNRSIASLAAETLPITWTAFVVASITGASLFSSHAIGYAANFHFRMKILLLILAGVNMMTFHWAMGRATDNWKRCCIDTAARQDCGAYFTRGVDRSRRVRAMDRIRERPVIRIVDMKTSRHRLLSTVRRYCGKRGCGRCECRVAACRGRYSGATGFFLRASHPHPMARSSLAASA